MMLKKIVLFACSCIALTHFVFANPSLKSSREIIIMEQYHLLDFEGKKPSYEAFNKAMKGYKHLNQTQMLPNNKYLTLIDFSMSSNQERLWILDMENLAVVHHMLVSHGRNTGDEYAVKFSNIMESNMSSIGFYVTGETYIGKHGFSLRLNGLDVGYNDNAYNRAIVMHSADYVTHDFAKKVGRLGRSLGCPAIPPELHKEVIGLIQGGTLMFIYYPDQEYLQKSKFLM